MSSGRLIRAVLLGFVPGCGAVFLLLVGAVDFIAPRQVTWGTLASLLAELLGMTAGFAAALSVGITRINSEPGMKRRSMAAGSLAPLVAGAISQLFPHASLAAVALLSLPAGALAALPVLLPLFFSSRRLAGAGAGPRGAG